jgi:hypothetical protein
VTDASVQSSTDQITVACETCAANGITKTYTGNRGGRSSATGKLALHMANVHGYRNPDAKGKRRAAARTEIDDDAHPALAVVRGIADEIGTGKGAPSRDELSTALGRGLGVLSLSVASWAAETDPRPLTDEQRDAVTAELTLAKGPARDIMDPFARALSGTNLNKKYGRTIVENVDLAAAISELGKVGIRWRRYFRAREAWVEQNGVIDVVGRAAPRPPSSSMDGFVPGAPQPGAPQQDGGIVWTPEMVAELAARRGA